MAKAQESMIKGSHLLKTKKTMKTWALWRGQDSVGVQREQNLNFKRKHNWLFECSPQIGML